MIACDQVGAYVADALPEEQRDHYGVHLDGCENCRREVCEFAETAVALASLVATPAPTELRVRVLEAAARVRPLPPMDLPTESTVNVVSLDQHRATGRRGFLRWGVAAAAVGVVGLGASGTISGWRAAQSRSEAMAAQKRLLSAPDAKVVAIQATADLAGSYVVSKRQNRAMFVAERMPTLPAGKVFQQWTLVGGAKAISNVTFDSIDEPVWLTGDIAGAAGLAISIENTGGAQTPDHVLGKAKL